MAIVGLVFVFLLLGSSPSGAAESLTCAHWGKMLEADRIFYAVGLRDGVVAGLAYWGIYGEEFQRGESVVQALSRIASVHFVAEIAVVCRKSPTEYLTETAALAVQTVLREKGALPLKPPR